MEWSPAPGVNIISGANAQGKTTLLEAVLFAATTKSHRTSADDELCRHGAEGFHVRLDGARAAGPVTLEANWWRGAKRFKVNGVAQTRLSDLLGRINVVFFSPDDMALVKGAASVRRRFLDMELSQIQPACLNALQQYRQALRQRNELLRAAAPQSDLVEVWDVQLDRHGRVLMEARAEFIGELSALAGEMYHAVAGGERLSVAYQPDVRDGDITSALARHRASDLRQRMTTHGPHRDDLEILIDGKPARAFGSQGQQKTAVLALRLAEVGLMRRRTGELPVLMLDEVLAELDPDRARRLFAALPGGVQALVTTTSETPPAGCGADAAWFRMRGGSLGQE